MNRVEGRFADYYCSISIFSLVSSLLKRAPGARPVVDDQGSLPLCTRFALAKAVANAFATGKVWGAQGEIDIDQCCITTAFLQETKVISLI